MAYRQTARSEEVREASRTALLTAARHLFAIKGYEATTMQDIVTAAHTSIGNAYFYFKSKQHLLFELLSTEAHRFWNATESAVASVPPGTGRIACIIYTNISGMLTSGQDLVKLLLSSEHGGPALAMVEDRTVARWLNILAENAPAVPMRERGRIGTMIWGANSALVGRAISGNIKGTPADIAKYCVRWSLRGLEIPEPEIEAALLTATKCAARARRRVS